MFCQDEKGKIDIIFFNSREGYIKKILTLNNYIIISGKISFFKKKYQITNPLYVVPVEKEQFVNVWKYQIIPLLEEFYSSKINELKEILTNNIFQEEEGLQDFTEEELKKFLDSIINK